jgi:Lamin Tail Domain
MGVRHLPPLVASLLVLAHCAPITSESPESDGEGGSTAELAIALEPGGALDAAPPILRIRLQAAPGDWPPDETRLALISGDIGSAQLGQIARNDISNALNERIVPSLSWREDDVVVLAPLQALAAGERYTVASGAPKASFELTVALDDPIPHLRLVWPPQGHGAGAWPARWCGSPPLTPPGVDVALAPDRGAATLAPGAVESGAAAHCLRLLAPSQAPAEQLRVPPPAILDEVGAVVARIDPAPITASADPVATDPVACDVPGEAAFGDGCIRVWDDRALIRPPEAPLLWVLTGLGPEPERVLPSTGDPFLITGLPSSSTLPLSITTVDLAGLEQSRTIMLETQPSMPHVVINEVLANPVGIEPEQEWVELYNDGSVTAQLEGWRLEDVGNEAVLPAVQLAPGAFALVVNEAFDAESDWDVRPPEGSLLIRVPQLANNGLKNAGEPLLLRDGEGTIVSRAPATPKPKEGLSIARRDPKALDGEDGAFERREPTPNAPNVSFR